MDYRARIQKLSRVFLLLGIVLALALVYRMLIQGPDLTARVYYDRTMEQVLVDLAAAGVIQPADDGVSIDLEGLRGQIARPGTRQYILQRQAYLRFEKGRLVVDPAAIMVQNRRLIRRAAALDRGRILDRKGRPLAVSRMTLKNEYRRHYSLGRAALPLLGVAHPVYGLKGLEADLAPYIEGRQLGFVDRFWYFLAGRKPQYDVVLTIDAALQQIAFAALGDHSGSVVVVEAASGAVLAAASSPSFDPATPPGPTWDAEAAKGRGSGFVNRAFDQRYPPGSIFKLVAAAAWMEAPDYDPRWGLECNGHHPRYQIREFRGRRHGWVGLENAIRLSCNVFFADIGPRLGPVLLEQAEAFGFNRSFALLDETPNPPIGIPSRAFNGPTALGQDRRWQGVDFRHNPKLVAQAAIGQNLVEATPLQMALVGAALAYGGRLMAPRLVERIQYIKRSGDQTPILKTFKAVPPHSLGQVCSPETAQALRAMMARVMDTGTGFRLKKIFRDSERYHLSQRLPQGAKNLVAGKTGTAQTGRGREDHSWFLGLAPGKDPKYAVVVVVEHGGMGADIAGPIALEVMHAVLNLDQDEDQ